MKRLLSVFDRLNTLTWIGDDWFNRRLTFPHRRFYPLSTLLFLPVLATILSPAIVLLYFIVRRPENEMLAILLMAFAALIVISVPVLAVVAILKWRKRRQIMQKFAKKRTGYKYRGLRN